MRPSILARGLATVLLLSGPGLAFGQETLGIKAPFPKGLFLVRARIKHTEPPKSPRAKGEAALEIVHVYAGPDKLKGKTFPAKVTTPPIGSSFGVEPTRYVWRIGAEGLWWVRKASPPPLKKDADGLLRQPAYDPEGVEPILDLATLKAYRIEAFPYQRDQFGGDYEEGLTWAEAVEDVYLAKSAEERGNMLERLAAGRAPISDWAAAMLVLNYSRMVPAWPMGVKLEASAEETKALRRQAGNKKLSPESRIALDRMLAHLDPFDWPKSADRENLLSRGFATDNLDDFSMACLHMIDALWAKEMDIDFYARVLDPVLAKGDKMPQAKQWLLGRTLREARWDIGNPQPLSPDADVRHKRIASHFAWLKKHLKETKSPLLRAHAAAGFKAIGYFRDADADELRQLCGKDATAKAELEYVLGVRVYQEDDGAARRAAHFLGKGMQHENGPYHVAWPFYTGGAPIARGNKLELPVVKDLLGLRMRLKQVLYPGVGDQVTSCKLWDLRAALTPDPKLKLLADAVTNDRSVLYVVHLYQPGRTDDLGLLVRVERGTGSVVGVLGAMGTHRTITRNEKQLRQAAIKFITAYNKKSKADLDPLLGKLWCHGGYHFYKMADGSKPTYPPEVDIGPYGKPARPWNPGPTARGLPPTLPTDINLLVRYEDQRRALYADPKGLQALDNHMNHGGYVALLGPRPDSSMTLLMTIENGQAKIMGTLSGLTGK